MFKSRRKFIKSVLSLGAYGLAMASGLVHSALANSVWPKENFKSGTYDETLTRLFKNVEFIDSHKIKLRRLPRVAENGAIVPIKVISSLNNVNKISIMVEKNPTPLIAEFYLSATVEPRVSARIKMAETCDVVVIVEAEGKYYRKSKKVTVAVGGCGG